RPSCLSYVTLVFANLSALLALMFMFYSNDPPTTEIYTLSLHDALPIYDQVFNNIMKYGNTTAASIPIALTEAWEQDRIKSGDLVVLAAFGSGFTWASAVIRW